MNRLTELDIKNEFPAGGKVGHRLKEGVTVEEAIHRLAWYETMSLADVVRLANEYATPKLPEFSSEEEPLWCPTCGSPVDNYEDAECCCYCGQALAKPNGYEGV